MKKLIVGTLLIFLFAGSIIAQPEGRARKQIEAQKVAYITKRLELTPKEAEVFWPLYNQFQSDREAINKKYKNKKRVVNMTDEELEEHMLGTFKRDQEILDTKKAFFEEMKTKFSIRKIAMLHLAEKEFRTSILDKWKEKRKERRQRRQ